ncbi:MAG: hypothetical protein EA352_04645 [Gemmatimonadales bacterium]|nr:MAG: hypothetical protein EA352_04645 [Gemmatimonadales bacterium]
MGFVLALTALLALGAWATLDTTSLGQTLVCRPLVGGTLAGAIVGDPVAGALAGGLLELLVLGALPVGAVRLPEPGAAGVVAGAVAALPSTPVLPPDPGLPGGTLALALVLGVALAWVGGWSQSLLREGNLRRLEAAVRRAGGGAAGLALGRLHARCLLADAGRGVLLTGGGLLVAWALVWGVAVPGWVRGPGELLALWPATRLETAVALGAAGLLGLGRLVAVVAPPGRSRTAMAGMAAAGFLVGASLVAAAMATGLSPGGGTTP